MEVDGQHHPNTPSEQLLSESKLSFSIATWGGASQTRNPDSNTRNTPFSSKVAT